MVATPTPSPDPVTRPVREVLELFATERFAPLHFPDVDAAALAALEDDVQRHHQAVEAARLALETAREQLKSRQDSLLDRARRALAYLRVYAAGDGALEQQLGDLALARDAAGARRSRRRRKPAVVSAESCAGADAGGSAINIAELPLGPSKTPVETKNEGSRQLAAASKRGAA